jgi:hypothetical protein
VFKVLHVKHQTTVGLVTDMMVVLAELGVHLMQDLEAEGLVKWVQMVHQIVAEMVELV